MKERLAYRMFRVAVWLRDRSYELAGIEDDYEMDSAVLHIHIVGSTDSAVTHFDPKMN